MQRIVILFMTTGLLMLLGTCVEPYEFQIINGQPTLVVEGQISDMSYVESLDLPSDGRVHEVILRLTNDVSNKANTMVSYATVMLRSSKDEKWYLHELFEPGHYILDDPNFEAEPGVQYKLWIHLSDGEEYESTWEQMPDEDPGVMDSVFFQEAVHKDFVYMAGENKIRDIETVDLYLNLPVNTDGKERYYRWDFIPTWLWEAPFGSNVKKSRICWISNKYYMNEYVVAKDNVGGYPSKITSVDITDNHRVWKKFSLLISQYSMTEDYYNFWKELKDQSSSGGLFDPPFYNLKTNFQAINNNKKVTGYFGVVREKGQRWYFSVRDLSYWVVDRTVELCSISYGPDGPGGPECYDCIDYPYGVANNAKPSWWEDK